MNKYVLKYLHPENKREWEILPSKDNLNPF